MMANQAVERRVGRTRLALANAVGHRSRSALFFGETGAAVKHVEVYEIAETSQFHGWCSRDWNPVLLRTAYIRRRASGYT
jgi:hypothetical protein